MQTLTILLRCRDKGRPLGGAEVLAAYSDGTFVHGETDSEGQCELDIYRSDDDMTVVAAAEDYKAYILSTIPEQHGNCIVLEMEAVSDGRFGNFVMFHGSTGHIPDIEGRLNPVNDPKGLYVYGDNLSINGVAAHPAVYFKLYEWMVVRDSKGMESSIRFILVEGHFSLLEYTTPEPWPK